MSSMMLKSTRSVVRTSLRTTRSVAPRAVDGNVTEVSTSKNNTIFYGGTAFTEREWEEAVASGRIAEAVPVSAGTPSSATPTITSLMAFAGPAPEVTNGRLAMLGFISAVAAEFVSGDSVLKQWSEEPTGIALTFIVFMAASLVPLTRGADTTEAFGPFTPAAEKLNGRAAMIGFAALLAIESFKHAPLF